MDEPQFDEDEMINDYVEDYDEPPPDDYDAMMLEEYDAMSQTSNTNPTDSAPQAKHFTVDHDVPTQAVPTEMADYGNFEEPQTDGRLTKKPTDYQRNYDALFSFER